MTDCTSSQGLDCPTHLGNVGEFRGRGDRFVVVLFQRRGTRRDRDAPNNEFSGFVTDVGNGSADMLAGAWCELLKSDLPEARGWSG